MINDHPDSPTCSLSADGHPEFWTARPILHHIKTAARQARTSPWATLAVILADVVAATDPGLKLPPLTGGDASANLYVGLVGPAGMGKGGATATARRAVRILAPDGHRITTETRPIGTGEGLAKMFMPEDDQPPLRRAVLDVPEVDTLAALGGRQGSTLMPVLRSAWMGEAMGFNNADAARRTNIPAHEYRLAVIAGIQPRRAGALLDDADGGTPQRWVWAPVDDPGAWPPHDRTPFPGVETVTLPPEALSGAHYATMPPQVHAAVATARYDRLRAGLASVTLDGHALLAREKIAVALALLDGRATVTDDDWELSATVMAVSDATREQVETIRRAADTEARTARATERVDVDTEARERNHRTRAARHITNWADRGRFNNPVREGAVTQGARSDIRWAIPDALADAVRTGRLTYDHCPETGERRYELHP